MPVFRLIDAVVFPPPHMAEAGGLLAVGGDLRPERMLAAYRQGIFPWYSEGEPIWWHSPDPRFVLEPACLHVPRSLEKTLRRGDFEVRLDTAFAAVLTGCARKPRAGQRGTWITRDLRRSYLAMHGMGLAHSAESWRGGRLCGGLYGVCIGDVFFGESMYADEDDASKVAFVTLVRWLASQGVELVDSQVHTEHVARFGGTFWPRERYLARISELTERPPRVGPWDLGGFRAAIDART
jgi:leucyl/phenylalanyl-tRNA--protein transferase